MNIPRLTKYERARVLGTRAQQLSNGAKPMVDIGNLTDVMDIAKKELREHKLPFIIRRPDTDVKVCDTV
jgi:DNA-directed RNA polymerase I, II, and III subunit RPABC2